MNGKVHHTLINKLNNNLIKIIQEYNIKNHIINRYLNELREKTFNIRDDLEYYKGLKYSLFEIKISNNEYFNWCCKHYLIEKSYIDQ